MITKYNIFLDDIRVPTDVTWVNIPVDQHYSVVRSYKEFVDLITLRREVPKYVCYDHDLADPVGVFGILALRHNAAVIGLNNDEIPYNSYNEKTGYDCAKWLVNYCMERGIKHPPYIVHSMNPIGKLNIESYINSYNRN
jgi:hypothetical protein